MEKSISSSSLGKIIIQPGYKTYILVHKTISRSSSSDRQTNKHSAETIEGQEKCKPRVRVSKPETQRKVIFYNINTVNSITPKVIINLNPSIVYLLGCLGVHTNTHHGVNDRTRGKNILEGGKGKLGRLEECGEDRGHTAGNEVEGQRC